MSVKRTLAALFAACSILGASAAVAVASASTPSPNIYNHADGSIYNHASPGSDIYNHA